MSLTDPFLKAITDDLYNDFPRLVYADWLEENGDPDRAEFIRVQCELEPIRDQYEIERAAELHKRENEILRDFGEKWLGKKPTPFSDSEWYPHDKAAVQFRRGFVDQISLPTRSYLECGAELRTLHPTIRRVVLHRVHGYGARLAECEALEGLAELELACWYSDEDAEAIASSSHLQKLQVLELWLGRIRPLQNTKLCRILASGKAWPDLKQLTILNPDGEKERSRKRMVKVANEAAGREIAVYQRGYPELFPFAADFWDLFPGHLPDGRMAMGSEDHSTTPPSLCVITFDKNGRQTSEVISVPVPDDVLKIPTDEWYKHKHQLREQLQEKIGLRPGFIRIRDALFPYAKDSYYNSPSPDAYLEELVGHPDIDDSDASWEEEPEGCGGRVAYIIRNGEWELNWDRHGDKTGHIHST